MGGTCNTTSGYNNVHIIGSNLSATVANTVFVENLCATGNVDKAGGSFRIPHPDPTKTATQDLIHSFVESPTAGDNIYRFNVKTLNCQATIELPDYFKYLNKDEQVWISPQNHFGNAYGIIDETQSTVSVCSNTDGKYNVLIIGTRKDDWANRHWNGVEQEITKRAKK